MNQDEDEDVYLYGDATSAPPPVAVPVSQSVVAEQDMEQASEEGEVDDEDEEEESDSDIEFVIETEPGKRAVPPPSAQPFVARTSSISKPSTAERSSSTGNQIKAETSLSSVPTVAQEKVEIDKVAEYNGESLFNLDLESLEEKPWRKPGADVTDYFNYGFDEFTWTAYTSKQTNLRNEFNPAKMMTGLPPEMQAMMGQFPMPPEMMFGGMGMMPDPNAFSQQGFGQQGFGGQNFGGGGPGGFGGFPQQGQQQQQIPGQQMSQQQQLQPPRYPIQSGRIGSPNPNMNIPSGPQAQQGYWGNTNGSMRGNPSRGTQRRY